MSKIMEGVRVLEVADFLFVPSAGAVLSEWGADVIKVEHHVMGDPMRGQVVYHPNFKGPLRPFNTLIEIANRGKRSIGLNLGSDQGREILYALAKTCDVFLTSKLTPSRQKLKVDVDDIRAHNPNIIYARGSGRGVRGEEASDPGFDFIDFWFRSGNAMGAKPKEFPYLTHQSGAGFGDLTSGMNLAGGISAALFHREKTGEPSVVDVSLMASGLWSLGAAITLSNIYEVSSTQPDAGQAPNPLVNVYRTRDDRWIALCALQGERYWPSLCAALGRPDVGADPRYSTLAGLEEHSAAVTEILSKEFGSLDFEAATTRLRDFSGPWAPVQDAYTVAQDDQAAANGYFQRSTTTTGEAITVVEPPVQFDETPAGAQVTPEFNADCEEVLADLGLTMDQILELKLSNAVA